MPPPDLQVEESRFVIAAERNRWRDPVDNGARSHRCDYGSCGDVWRGGAVVAPGRAQLVPRDPARGPAAAVHGQRLLRVFRPPRVPKTPRRAVDGEARATAEEGMELSQQQARGADVSDSCG